MKNLNPFVSFGQFKLAIFIALVPTAALADQNSPEVIIFGTLGFAAFIAILISKASKAEAAAASNEDLAFADRHTLYSKLQRVLARDGIFSITVIRQSGNVERVLEDLDFVDVSRTISQTMQKAQIDTVSLTHNENSLSLYRVMHNGRGRQEGKRIGGFDIRQTGQHTASSQPVLDGENPSTRSIKEIAADIERLKKNL